MVMRDNDANDEATREEGWYTEEKQEHGITVDERCGITNVACVVTRKLDNGKEGRTHERRESERSVYETTKGQNSEQNECLYLYDLPCHGMRGE